MEQPDLQEFMEKILQVELQPYQRQIADAMVEMVATGRSIHFIGFRRGKLILERVNMAGAGPPNEKIELTGLNRKWWDEAMQEALRLDRLDQLSDWQGQFVDDMRIASQSIHWRPTRKQFNQLREIAGKFK